MEATTSASPAPLERSVSQQSGISIRSHRSAARIRKRLASQPSSSASSIAPSDKSLTSFPSFSPDSPREETCCFLRGDDDSTTVTSSRKTSGQSLAISEHALAQGQGERAGQERSQQQHQPPPSSIVDNLITSSPVTSARGALFEDAPLASRKIPGALHHADNEHVERLIARYGAVNLVRQIAEDLAQRDAQIASLRRRADERERALRKIILDCGLSSLDLETRLRAIEQKARAVVGSRRPSGAEGLSDLVTDAMAEDVRYPFSNDAFNDATVRASSVPLPAASDSENPKGTGRGWKEYFWGTGTARKSSRASSRTREASKAPQPTAVVRAARPGERRPPLQGDLFNPPEEDSAPSSSRSPSAQSGHTARKPSLASLALRLVAGDATVGREGEVRGRASSAQGGSMRTPSTSSVKTSGSARAVSTQGGPKALMAMRRPPGAPIRPVEMPPRPQPPERWDTMVSSPGGELVSQHQSYGPVEMDTILPLEAQPPTFTHIYNNREGADYLTDRFGFIYDQRRKKRQREAAQMARHVRKGSRAEMLGDGRSGLSPVLLEDSASGRVDTSSDGRPGTPCSSEEPRDDAKPKRWQDYLKIATFPTELLAHMPSISTQGFEVLEASEPPEPEPEPPSQSPSIVPEERGFLPSATTTAAIAPIDRENQAPSGTEQSSATLAKEDAEPVRLLLENLNQLHDTLQREKMVRWNDFLRKVRAERKRDGEAAAAAAAAAVEARFQRAAAVMPEARLGDGELIGVASLGLQGKVGRAKANEFRSLVLGGIPVAYRAKIWSECCGAKALRIPGYYDSLVSRPEAQDDPQVVLQIKADITRTLTDNIFFRKGPGVQKLDQVLLAYARRNPDIGYCQGMNLIVANLLLVTPSAEDAFWILASIVETILPPHYLDHSLLASRADQQVLRRYVAEVLPRLSAHLDALAIDLETMTFPWFLSLFTDCLSAEALFRVWDVVLCSAHPPHDGPAFLFRVALALLKLNESMLLACGSPAAVYTYINHQMTNHAISIDGLVQASEALRRLVRWEDIESRRTRAIEAEREQVRLREERLRVVRAGAGLAPVGIAGGNEAVTAAAAAAAMLGSGASVASVASGRGRADDAGAASAPGDAGAAGEGTEEAPAQAAALEGSDECG